MEHQLGSHMYLPTNFTQPAAASANAVSGRCIFRGISVNPDGTNDITVNVWDSTTVSGATRLLETDVVFAGNEGWQCLDVPHGLPCFNGIYVEITCAGTLSYRVHYDS